MQRRLFGILSFVGLCSGLLLSCAAPAGQNPGRAERRELGLERVALVQGHGFLSTITSGVTFEPSSEAGQGKQFSLDLVGGEALTGWFSEDPESPLLLDLDGDGAVGESEVFPWRGEILRVQPTGEASAQLEFRREGTGLGYQELALWVCHAKVDSECFDVALIRFPGGGSILARDTDADGSFESHIAAGNTVFAGGRVWALELDLEGQRLVLQETDQAPVAVGFAAPTFTGPVAGESAREFDLAQRKGRGTLLVFCHAGCAGCRQLAPTLISLHGELGARDGLRIVSVVKNSSDAAGLDVGWPHVISEAAWSLYHVRPTPTLIFLDADGVIRYRGSHANLIWQDLVRGS